MYTYYAYAYTNIHTYMHTYMHTCIRTYIHACMHAYIHTCMGYEPLALDASRWDHVLLKNIMTVLCPSWSFP